MRVGEDINPWLAMWSQPKRVVREIVHHNPRFGVMALATIYALHSLCFYANWWSLGLSAHFYPIFIAGMLLSPLLGWLAVSFLAYLLRLSCRLLGGQAPYSFVRAAYAWSLLPYSLNLLMWVILIFLTPSHIFILDSGGVSLVFIHLVGFLSSFWSFFLLLHSLAEVQGFTLLRSFSALVLFWLFSSSVIFMLFSASRYLYILTF